MTFQPLIPTVLTPVAVSVLTDPATGILAVAEALQPDLAQGFQIDALRLRLEMERELPILAGELVGPDWQG